MKPYRMGWVVIVAAVSAVSCGIRPGISVGIPGTPVSVGASVPLKAGAKGVRYRMVTVTSIPEGARVEVNGELMGSTPVEVAVPFEKKWPGGAKGAAHILVDKRGYLPEGATVFPVGQGVARTRNGPPVATLTFRLRPE